MDYKNIKNQEEMADLLAEALGKVLHEEVDFHSDIPTYGNIEFNIMFPNGKEFKLEIKGDK